jgi:hypothetical protein
MFALVTLWSDLIALSCSYALWKDKLHIDEVKATGIDPRAADRTTSKFIVGAGTQDLAGKVAWNTCALLNPQDRAAIDKKE